MKYNSITIAFEIIINSLYKQDRIKLKNIYKQFLNKPNKINSVKIIKSYLGTKKDFFGYYYDYLVKNNPKKSFRKKLLQDKCIIPKNVFSIILYRILKYSFNHQRCSIEYLPIDYRNFLINNPDKKTAKNLYCSLY